MTETAESADKKRKKKGYWNWNTGLRWFHITVGLMISAYFWPLTTAPGDPDYWTNHVNGDLYTNLVGNVVLLLVFWSGIAKWQLPRIRRWIRKAKDRRAQAA